MPRYWYIWPGRLFVRPYVYLRTKFWLWSGREWWAMCAWCFQPFGPETCAPENRDKRHECSPILRFILWGPQMDWSNDVLLALFLTISMVLAVIGTSCAEHQKSKPSPIPAVRNWKCNPLTFDVKTSDATAWLCHDERTGAIIDAKVRP